MKEQDFFKNFAKILGAEDALAEIEKKEEKEQRLLEQLSQFIGAPIEAVKEEERDLPAHFVAKVEYVEDKPEEVVEEVVEQVEEIVEEVAAPVEVVVENVVQPMPELPKDVITTAVEKISKVAPDKIQKAVDAIPDSVRKELDIIRKSIADFHRFAQRHSQMGGGGEVNFRYLDDVDRASIGEGKYLTYNSTTKKFQFVTISGGGAPQVQSDWTETDNTAPSFIKNKPSIPQYIDDLTDVTITGAVPGQVLKYNGLAWVNDTDLTTSGGSTTPGYYGSFFDNSTQHVANVNTPTAVLLRSAPIGVNGITVVANSKITTTYSGVYNFQFSFQLHNQGGGGNGTNVIIWLRKNGVDVADTSTDVNVGTNNPYVVAAWNFIFPSSAGDYWEFMWATDNTNIVIDYVAPTSTWPGTPSAIITVQQVAAILIPTDITGTANNSNYLDGNHANAFQTHAGLSANVATLTSNNSLYLDGIAANQYAYANAVYSQILWINPSPSPATTFRTNIEATDHGAQIDISTGIPGFGNMYTWVLDEVGLSFPNGAGIQTVPFVGDADLLGGIAADQYAYANAIPSLTGYQTTSGLSANVAKLSANNSLYLGGVAANQYAYANQITTYTLPTANTSVLGGVKIDGTTITISNGVISSPNQDLSGYQTSAGLSANVATLSSNNSLYLGGIAANQYAYANSLTAYQTSAGLSANIATLTSNNSLYLGGVAANGYARLNTTVVFGSVTSNTATAFIAGDAAISGVALQMPHEGALRNMSNTASTMYFDVNNGGSAHGNFNFRSSNNFTSLLHLSSVAATFNSSLSISGQTPYVGRSAFNVALDTVVTVDNIKYRVSNQGGIFPQIASASGSQVDVCYDVEGIVNGTTNPTYANNTGYLLAAIGTWLSIYSTHGMDSRGDRLTAHITDKAAGKIYRVTFMRTNNSSNIDGYNIIVERIM